VRSEQKSHMQHAGGGGKGAGVGEEKAAVPTYFIGSYGGWRLAACTVQEYDQHSSRLDWTRTARACAHACMRRCTRTHACAHV